VNVAASGGCGAHRVSEDAREPVDRRCLDNRLEPEFDGDKRRPGTLARWRVRRTKFEFYRDLVYILVVLGNTDSGNEAIAAHVRTFTAVACAGRDLRPNNSFCRLLRTDLR
jgi:hypothetical protein